MQAKRLVSVLVLMGIFSALVWVGVSSLSGPRALASDYSQQRWEYLAVTPGKVYWSSTASKAKVSETTVFDGEAVDLEQLLDRLGQQGWELVSIVGQIGGDQEFVFKRPIK